MQTRAHFNCSFTKMTTYGLLATIFVIFTLTNVSAKKLPSYVTLCKRNEPDMNGCILNAIEQIRPHLKEGIPELYIPPADPFMIPKATLNSGKSFNATFEDIKVYNVDSFQIKKIDVELDKNKLQLEVFFPYLRIDANYKMKGRVLLFELNSSGAATGNYSDISATTIASGIRETRKGKEFIKINDKKLNLKFGKTSLYFHDLFKGNEMLTRNVNQAINANIKQLLQDLYPVIHDTASQLLFSFVGEIFNRISLDTLFPK